MTAYDTLTPEGKKFVDNLIDGVVRPVNDKNIRLKEKLQRISDVCRTNQANLTPELALALVREIAES